MNFSQVALRGAEIWHIWKQHHVIECFWKMMKSIFHIRSMQLQDDGLYTALLIKVFASFLALRLHIRRDLSGSGLLTIVCKRFLIRELEDRFESQSRASRSGIALGVSPSGVSPQVVDHRLESATIPRPIAIAKGAKQLREGVGGGH